MTEEKNPEIEKLDDLVEDMLPETELPPLEIPVVEPPRAIGNTQPIGSYIDAALEVMDRRAASVAVPIKTPWQHIDVALGGGFWPGLYMVSGASGSGMRQWCLQVALQAARRKTPVLYVGLELDSAQLVARLAGLMLADTGIAPPWSEVYLGRRKDWLDLARAKCMNEMRNLHFYFEQGGRQGWDIDQLEAKMGEMRQQYPEPDGPGSRPFLVVLDSLAFVTTLVAERSEINWRLGRIAHTAYWAAKEHSASVLALSAVSDLGTERLVELRKTCDLGLIPASDLLGLSECCADVEKMADSVLVLCRGQSHDVRPKEYGAHTNMYLALAKARAGKTCWQKLNFNGGWFWQESPKERVARMEAEKLVRNPGGGTGGNPPRPPRPWPPLDFPTKRR